MIFEKIKKIIVEELGTDEDIITLETNLQEDLGADSLDAVELIMVLKMSLILWSQMMRQKS